MKSIIFLSPIIQTPELENFHIKETQKNVQGEGGADTDQDTTLGSFTSHLHTIIANYRKWPASATKIINKGFANSLLGDRMVTAVCTHRTTKGPLKKLYN